MNNVTEQDLLKSLSERHKSILNILQLQGSVSVSDLAERLEVSEVTIRKDLSALEKQNKLYRTHGRAIPISPYIGDRHINEKEKQFVLEKRAIGKAAAALVNEHDSILMAWHIHPVCGERNSGEEGYNCHICFSVSVFTLVPEQGYRCGSAWRTRP